MLFNICLNVYVDIVMFLARGVAPGMEMSGWNISTTIQWIVIKCCTDIHSPLVIKLYDFGSPLTSPDLTLFVKYQQMDWHNILYRW